VVIFTSQRYSKRPKALSNFALAFRNKVSQQMVVCTAPCSLVACSYQCVVKTLIFDNFLYKIQLRLDLARKEGVYQKVDTYRQTELVY